eukprot:tig00000459_g1164.t1
MRQRSRSRRRSGRGSSSGTRSPSPKSPRAPQRCLDDADEDERVPDARASRHRAVLAAPRVSEPAVRRLPPPDLPAPGPLVLEVGGIFSRSRAPPKTIDDLPDYCLLDILAHVSEIAPQALLYRGVCRRWMALIDRFPPATWHVSHAQLRAAAQYESRYGQRHPHLKLALHARELVVGDPRNPRRELPPGNLAALHINDPPPPRPPGPGEPPEQQSVSLPEAFRPFGRVSILEILGLPAECAASFCVPRLTSRLSIAGAERTGGRGRASAPIDISEGLRAGTGLPPTGPLGKFRGRRLRCLDLAGVRADGGALGRFLELGGGTLVRLALAGCELGPGALDWAKALEPHRGTLRWVALDAAPPPPASAQCGASPDSNPNPALFCGLGSSRSKDEAPPPPPPPAVTPALLSCLLESPRLLQLRLCLRGSDRDPAEWPAPSATSLASLECLHVAIADAAGAKHAEAAAEWVLRVLQMRFAAGGGQRVASSAASSASASRRRVPGLAELGLPFFALGGGMRLLATCEEIARLSPGLRSVFAYSAPQGAPPGLGDEEEILSAVFACPVRTARPAEAAALPPPPADTRHAVRPMP